MIPLQFCSPEELDILQIMIYLTNNEQNNKERLQFDSESLHCSLTAYKTETKCDFFVLSQQLYPWSL